MRGVADAVITSCAVSQAVLLHHMHGVAGAVVAPHVVLQVLLLHRAWYCRHCHVPCMVSQALSLDYVVMWSWWPCHSIMVAIVVLCDVVVVVLVIVLHVVVVTAVMPHVVL